MSDWVRSHDGSIWGAIAHVASLSQRIVDKRIRLARLDARQVGNEAVRNAVLTAVGALFLAGAWIAAMGTLVAAIPWPLWTRWLIVAGLHSAIGAAVLSVGLRAWRHGLIREAQEHEEAARVEREERARAKLREKEKARGDGAGRQALEPARIGRA